MRRSQQQPQTGCCVAPMGRSRGEMRGLTLSQRRGAQTAWAHSACGRTRPRCTGPDHNGGGFLTQRELPRRVERGAQPRAGAPTGSLSCTWQLVDVTGSVLGHAGLPSCPLLWSGYGNAVKPMEGLDRLCEVDLVGGCEAACGDLATMLYRPVGHELRMCDELDCYGGVHRPPAQQCDVATAAAGLCGRR